MKSLLTRLMMVAAVGLFGLGLAACGGDGEAERAGKELDNAMKDAGKTLDKAADDVKKKLDD